MTNVTNVTCVTSANGNTLASPRVIQARKWCFTLNNYTDEEYATIERVFLKKKWKYVMGKEVGESGTPHIQGYVEHKNPIRFSVLKGICNRLHIEKAYGSLNQNIRYCSKEGNTSSNVEYVDERTLEERLLEAEYKDVVWKDWQQKILDILDNSVDKRKVFWFYEEMGNVGKSFLCKYIALKYDAIICSGKTNDIFNQVLIWRSNNPEELQIPPVLIDVPRSEFSHINYSAIEQLKNGFMYSGKYEGGKVFGLSPHVIVFSNVECNRSQLSEDRIVEVCIH